MTLYELARPYLNLESEGFGRIIISESVSQELGSRESIEIQTPAAFLESANASPKRIYSAIIFSGIFGVKPFDLCDALLRQATALLADQGVLAVEILPIEKLNAKNVKTLLSDPEARSDNSLLSRQALKSALSRNFELLEVKGSYGAGQPEFYVFRFHKDVMSSGLSSAVSGGYSMAKRGVFGILKRLGGKADSKTDRVIAPSALRRALSGKYIPINPRVLLLNPPSGMVSALKAYLNPKAISVYGASIPQKKHMSQDMSDIIYREGRTDIADEPNGSAEFIFVGDMSETLNPTEYFKLLEDIARIRNRGGCVLLRQDQGSIDMAKTPQIALSKTWPLQMMSWAKARNSSVSSSPLLIGQDHYSCVSEASPYDPLIRQDISAGENNKAIQKFKNYSTRNFFTAGEGARIVRLFPMLDHYCEALIIYAAHFGVTLATRFNLVEKKHSELPAAEIVQSLEKLIPTYEKNEAIIFDLIGELYRLSHDYDEARKFWVKSLFQTQKIAGKDEDAEILMRKIRLYLPCEIDCKTSSVIIADPLLKNTVPKHTVILAESKVDRRPINSLVERFDGELVFTPDLKGESETMSKAKFKPLIGLIAEDSDLSKTSHEYAAIISQDIIKALIERFKGKEIGAWLKMNQVSVALSVEDFLARHLLILEAYAKAANDNPQADILLAGGELGYFDTSLNLLLSRLSHDKVWLHSDQPKSNLKTYRSIFESKARVEAKPFTPSKNTSVDDWFNAVSKTYAETIEDYFSSQDFNIDNSCLILGNLANRWFGDSMVTLAGALQEAGESPVIIDSSTTRTAATDRSSLWEDCYVNPSVAETIPVLGMLRPKLGDPVLIEGLKVLREEIQNVVEALPLSYHGALASFAFSKLAARVLARDIPILLFNSLFAERLALRGGGNRLAVVSTREPHDHIITDVLRKTGLPTTLIQCTDILAHPRYKKPLADHVTAIDQTALDIFTDYLGVAESAITLTGSPRSQINFHPNRVKAITELLDSRGLALNPPLRVIFATRPGNLDVIIQALDVVAQQAAQHPGLQLIVKTHPREKPIRLAAYAKILEHNNIGGLANILNQGTAETLILISDGVISFPSAVVRVASELGKKALVYSPDEEASPAVFGSEINKPIKAQTIQQLSEHIKPLFSELINNAAPKKHNINSAETLPRICEVIQKQSRSRPRKQVKTRQSYGGVQKYSSLSLRETSRLIKRQAAGLEGTYADITLFNRALNLARDSKDFVLILNDVVSYAPPTLEAAQFFAKLTKAAAEHEPFNEAIGEVASQKLANYASQLEHNEIPPHPYTILVLAQSCAAAGHIDLAKSWYDFGKTQNCNAALRLRFEAEGEALRLLKWDAGKEAPDYIWPEKPRVIIVAERGTAPDIYRSALPNDAVINVYFDGKAGETLGGAKSIKSISSRDVLDDRAPELEGIIHRATLLAELITTQTLKLLKNSEHIVWLKDTRPAIEMELRAGLITQLRRHAALAKAIDGPYEAIVFACNTPAFLALFSDSLAGTELPIFTIGASQSPVRRRAFGAARKQGLSVTRDKQETLLKKLKKANSTKSLKEFDTILNKVAPRISEREDAQSVIAVTSWRITTIKDACLSLLENFPPDIPLTIFDTSRHLADAKRFLSDIGDFAAGSAQDIRPFSAQYHNIPNPDFKALKNSALAKSIFASVKATKDGKTLPHAVQLGLWNQIGTLLYKTLPMLYDLHIQISAACQNSGQTSLIVMPGRDAESLTAQNAAAKFGIRTIDVQTAYFSRGHTYTAPNGDVVTAMDGWSKDLFAEWFNIPDDKIHVLGTSRFDRFSKLRLSHEAQAEDVKPKTPNPRPHICVATQPIQSGLTKEMLSCLNDLFVGGVDFDCTVKLHPRQSENIIMEIESLAGELQGAGRMKVTKYGDLAQILLASDLVITAFSNVAIEAALMDCPVLIANFTGEDIPVPFMEFGIAEEARTHEDFEALAKRILNDEGFQRASKAKRRSYFELYPSQWRGEAGKDTVALILENMRKPILP